MNRRRAWQRLRALAAIGVLAFSGCDSQVKPSVPPVPAETGSGPSGAPPATGAPTPTLSPRQLPEHPTVVDGIQAAVRAGTISPATGYLYRFYAQWGDARLPEAYRGDPVEDDELAEAASADLSTFTAEEQAALRPFLLRPSQPGSYWSSDDVGAAQTSGVTLARAVTTAACVNAWSRLDLSIPVTIWGRCRAAANGQPTVPITSAMNKVATFMTDLWPRETGLMGKPIGDKFAGATQAATEPIEAGDGRLDIYIVEAPNVSYLRDVENDDLAVTRSAAPYDSGTSSAYMIVDPTKAASDAIFKSNVAHEFFHVLGDIYNSTGKYFCPYPNVTATCAGGDRKSHWISEASATWAEHHFVPEARPTEIYDARWTPFDATWQSLSDNRGTNNYNSFTWPMFLEQESASKEKIVQTVWAALKGKSTWADLQAAVDGVFPFRDHFRDFAVRVWNEKLEPGDPIVPRFQKLDPKFPTNRPDEVEGGERFAEAVALSLNQQVYRFSPEIRELWATYYDLSPSSATHKLTLDFSGLTPNGNLDVDALVRVRDVGWERRKLTSGTTTWCLDKPADAIEQVILVLANHSTTIEDWIRGDWSVTPSAEGCGTASDTLTYTQTLTQGNPGDPYYTTETQTLIVNLHLKANDFTGPNGNDFLNDGSTYTVSDNFEGILQTVDPACPIKTTAKGTGSGIAKEEDAFVASVYEDPESIGRPSQPPGGVWLAAVSGSVRLDVTTTETSCIGTGSRTDEVDIQLPDCEGKELNPGGLGPTRVFNISCGFSGAGSTWSLTGSLTVNR